tara:strand:- start:553 stop:795 length:243 start_codon:yes stop_codon:yes gene_type:complete
MKESTLLEMKKKVESLTNVIQYMINEMNHLKELGVGSLETLKLMPGYQEAIDELKINMEKEAEERKHASQNGVDKSNVEK